MESQLVELGTLSNTKHDNQMHRPTLARSNRSASIVSQSIARVWAEEAELVCCYTMISQARGATHVI